MAKTNIIKNQPNILEGLKTLTRLLTSKNFKEEDLQYTIEKYKFDISVIARRLISYVMNQPNILIYLNKYFNNYEIPKYSIIDLFKSFRYVLYMNKSLDSRKFMYVSSSSGKNELQPKIINLLDKYFSEVHNEQLSYNELRFYYNLYLCNIITRNDLYDIDTLMNNGKHTILFSGFEEEEEVKKEEVIPVDKIIEQVVQTNDSIDLINSDIHKLKISTCQSCKFFKNQLVPLDGNIGSNELADVVIVNLYPSTTDGKFKQVFSNKDSVIRKNISQFPPELKWIVIDLIPCAMKGKSEVGSDEEIVNQISQCTNSIPFLKMEKFKPTAKFILIGEETFNYFFSDKKFEEHVGTIIDNRYYPVPHPLNSKRGKGQILAAESWKQIRETITVKPVIQEQKEEEKPKKIGRKRLLLDVRELSSGEVLMIYTDEEGNKMYEKKPSVQTVYIKDKNYSECGIITDSVDYEMRVTKMQKTKLIKTLREKMDKLKN